jgi:hypothetical protein
MARQEIDYETYEDAFFDTGGGGGGKKKKKERQGDKTRDAHKTQVVVNAIQNRETNKTGIAVEVDPSVEVVWQRVWECAQTNPAVETRYIDWVVRRIVNFGDDELLNPDEVEVETSTASGPGGQNVNKVSTVVRLTHRNAGFVVESGETSSQVQNKAKARQKIDEIAQKHVELWIERVMDKVGDDWSELNLRKVIRSELSIIKNKDENRKM